MIINTRRYKIKVNNNNNYNITYIIQVTDAMRLRPSAVYNGYNIIFGLDWGRRRPG